MTLSLYDISIPPLLDGLRRLAAFLENGRLYADKENIDHATLLNARLFEDMLTLTGQVQRASDTAKRCGMRLGRVPDVPMPDDEKSFDDLQVRIAATIDFLVNVPEKAVNESVDMEVVLPSGSGQRVYTGKTYVLDFALPNFFFHVTTAYDLLRHNGVPLGKRHYLGWQ